MIRSLAIPSLALTLLAGAMACSDSTPNIVTTTMDASEADVVGRQAADLLGPAAGGLMAFDPDEAVLGLGFLFPTGPSGPSPRPLLAPIARALAGNAPGCSPEQSDPTDTDGDGIYDDNTVTFTAANCTAGGFCGPSDSRNVSRTSAVPGHSCCFGRAGLPPAGRPPHQPPS